MSDELRRRIEEIAARGRPDPPLSPEELMQKIEEIAGRNQIGPRLSPEEVMRRVKEIARSGHSISHDELPRR
jgi:DNA-binding IclR family transcriptional regulator